MARKQLVRCRYTKCDKLHDSKELNKEDAVMGGKSSYYHPDCYHMLTTINYIRDRFIQEVNPLITSQQIGTLVATINNIVFSKGFDVDCLAFILDYYIKFKPGALQMPQGLYYIIQDREAMSAWKKYQEQKAHEEIKKELEEINKNDVGEIGSWEIPSSDFKYKPQKPRSFADILH